MKMWDEKQSLVTCQDAPGIFSMIRRVPGSQSTAGRIRADDIASPFQSRSRSIDLNLRIYILRRQQSSGIHNLQNINFLFPRSHRKIVDKCNAMHRKTNWREHSAQKSVYWNGKKQSPWRSERWSKISDWHSHRCWSMVSGTEKRDA